VATYVVLIEPRHASTAFGGAVVLGGASGVEGSASYPPVTCQPVMCSASDVPYGDGLRTPFASR